MIAGICRAAGPGAVTAAPPASPAQLRSYVASALPRAQRISQSLQELGLRTGRNQIIAPLVLNYQQLLTLYRQVASAGQPQAASAELIMLAQQRTTATALALRLPVCAAAALPGQ
jgi:hypothetical protein